MSKPNILNDAFNEIDAGFYSSDLFHNEHALQQAEWYIARWVEEISSIRRSQIQRLVEYNQNILGYLITTDSFKQDLLNGKITDETFESWGISPNIDGDTITFTSLIALPFGEKR